MELTTVADDEVVIHDGREVRRYEWLAPDTEHELDGFAVRTLPAPGELLCRFATVNDVHFGETECGVIEGVETPVLRVPEGAEPYPEVMNRGAVGEIAAIDPAVVLVKGDLTSEGTDEQYAPSATACTTSAATTTPTSARRPRPPSRSGSTCPACAC